MTSSEAINGSIDVSGKFLRQSKTSLQSGSDARKATLIVMERMPGLNIGLLPHPSDNPWEDELNGTGMAYAGALSVTVEDGDIQASGNVLHCSNVTGLLLRFRSMSGFRGSNEQPERDMTVIANHLEKSLTEWQSDSQTLLDRHIADYRQYFDRVSVHLGPAHEDDVEVPFTEILRSRTGNAPHRLEKLSEAMFDFGRYLLISSSRQHTQPANLQGLWKHKDFPNWYGAYTTNINVEMNYWMTGPCALQELIEPLVTMNEELLDPGHGVAEHVLGCRGSAVFHNVDIWRRALPANGNPMWSFWPFGQAWMCRNVFDDTCSIKIARIWPASGRS